MVGLWLNIEGSTKISCQIRCRVRREKEVSGPTNSKNGEAT